MNIEWIHQAASCFCPSWFFLWLMKPVLGGAQTFHPTFPKVTDRQGRENGVMSALGRAVPPSSKGPLVIVAGWCYWLCMQRAFIVLHVPLTVEWESVIGCLMPPEKKIPFSSIFMAGSRPKWLYWLAELPCVKRPVLLPVLHVETVVYLQCISQLRLQKKPKQNKKQAKKNIQPLIYFLFPGNHSGIPVLPISNLFKHNGKSSPGRGRDGLVGAVIWINAGSQLKRWAAGKVLDMTQLFSQSFQS